MIQLAFDTATDACTVALRIDDREWTDHRVEARAHAQLLLPMIEGVVASAGIALSDIDVIVYGRGPGSFTGVRIAVAAAQGLGLSTQAGMLGISTLAALAQATHASTGSIDIVATLDARMSEIYLGHYRVDDASGVVDPRGEEQVCSPESLSGFDASCVFTGPGAERYVGAVPGSITPGVLPTASAMLKLASRLIDAGDVRASGEAAPVYLRDKVALTEQERAAGKS